MAFQPGRMSLFRSIQDAHKKDIKTYVSGHLNSNKLYKFEEQKLHREWPASTGAPVRMKPASRPVHLPVRKGQLTREQKNHKDMQDAVTEFSFGALGQYSGDSETVMRQGSTGFGRQRPCPPQLFKAKADLERSCLLEELKLPEIMVHSIKNKGSQKASGFCCKKREFITSHLAHVTKSDQYEAMKDFEENVMNLPDACDRKLLTGDRIVHRLQRRLNKKLLTLTESSIHGPNFLRLQAYTECFGDLIEQSTTFSRLLKFIKDEYDSYLAYILDENKVSNHRKIYSHIPTIHKAKSVTEAVRVQQIRLENIENDVKLLLAENERLRTEARKELDLEVPTATMSVHSSDNSASVVQTRVHVEAVTKDLQEQVEDLHMQIAGELETLDEMRRYQRENCVPTSVCQHFEQCIKETEVDIQKMLKQNEFLEQSIEELEEELQMILSQYGVKEKDARRLWKKVNVSKVLEYGRSLIDKNTT